MTESPISREIPLYSQLMVSFYTVFGLMLIDRHLSNTANYQYEADLIRLARGGPQLLEFPDSDDNIAAFDSFTDTFAANDRFRVSIISSTGVVPGDSRLFLQEVQTVGNRAYVPITLSIGASTVPCNGGSSELLIKTAD